MPSKTTTPPEDQIIDRNELPALEAEATAQGRHLAYWPYSRNSSRILVVRSYATAAKRDVANSYLYLGLPLPPADP